MFNAEMANDADSPGIADSPVVPDVTIFTSSTSPIIMVNLIECDIVGML